MSTPRIEYLADKFFKNLSYINIGKGKLAKELKCSEEEIVEAKDIAKQRIRRMNYFEQEDSNVRNVLVVGDLHTPFDMDGYADFLSKVYYQHKITDVVFIGDIIDNHYSSYHEKSTETIGPNNELDFAIYKLSKYVSLFPRAIVTVGNHDRLILRKAQTSGISPQWIRSFNEVLRAPGWGFVDHYRMGNNFFVHGEGMMASSRAQMLGLNVIQGHNHSKFEIKYVNHYNNIFGMQVGCGVNHNAYAMDYARSGPPMAKGCGVILDALGNSVPILIPYYEG